MQIRKISDEVQKKFPELQGMSSTDFYQVWKSYSDEITDNLINPKLPYLQFLKVGTFFIKNSAFKSKIEFLKRSIHFIDTYLNVEVNYRSLKEKLNKVKEIYLIKQQFYSKFLIYLDEWDTDDIPFYKKRIETFENYLEKIDETISEYDKRIITRDLEEQITDS